MDTIKKLTPLIHVAVIRNRLLASRTPTRVSLFPCLKLSFHVWFNCMVSDNLMQLYYLQWSFSVELNGRMIRSVRGDPQEAAVGSFKVPYRYSF